MQSVDVRGCRRSPFAWTRAVGLAGIALFSLLSGCGGASGSSSTAATSSALAAGVTTQTSTLPAPPPPPPLPPRPPVGADAGLFLFLVPDDASLTDPRIGMWRDAASETGVRIQVVTDSQFMAMGTTGALQYGGLILPDDMHTVATDDLIAAVRQYVTAGGRAMLNFDFGALVRTSTGDLVYPIPKARTSDLAGVDYILYDSLRDRTTGLGPVTGLRSTLRMLQVPPGKSMPYTASTSTTTTTPLAVATTTSTTSTTTTGYYLPVSTQDPGGAHGFNSSQYSNVTTPSSTQFLQPSTGTASVNLGSAQQLPLVQGVTKTTLSTAATSQSPVLVQGVTTTLSTATTNQSPVLTGVAGSTTDVLDAYSGYFYGYLMYASYVTSGTFAGATLTTSPFYGLVAGVNPVGSGLVLFVNMPVTYLKGATDAEPMHGLLSYFVHQMQQSAYLSPQPNGVAGMIFNWHLDSLEAQDPTLQLEKMGIFSSANPFSIHMTAGPDAVTFGDGLGWNLDNNPVAQGILQRFSAAGHDVGSHGGWIHDYYGLYANETNEAQFEPLLVLNQQSVNAVIGKAARSYAAPEGNNPMWAMDWLEQQGVVAAYFMGHTGVGVTRHYRGGVLRNPNLWVVPLTPMGLYATFEEFQANHLSKTEVEAWYHELVDFSIKNDTNRMVYGHPPGAVLWPDVVIDMLQYAANKGSSFRWYTMPMLADHMAKRLNVSWTQTMQADGTVMFNVSHPTSLNGLAWRLPKTLYQQPVVVSGTATVTDVDSAWQVLPSGSSVSFTAARL